MICAATHPIIGLAQQTFQGPMHDNLAMVNRCSLTTLLHHTLRTSGAGLLTHTVIYPLSDVVLHTNNYCNGTGGINGELTNPTMIDYDMIQSCTLSLTLFNSYVMT